MLLATPISVQSAPIIMVASVAISFLTCVLVLVFAAIEGNVPKWALPLPLSYAASDGFSRKVFRMGLTLAALMMTFALPVVIAAYRPFIITLIADDYSRNPRSHFVLRLIARLPLHLFMCLTVIGFFLQAAVPFDNQVLTSLRENGNLGASGARNLLHGCAAFVCFSSCFMTFGVVMSVWWLSSVSWLSVLMLWSKILLLMAANLISSTLSYFRFGRLEEDPEISAEGANIDPAKKRRVRQMGANQIGILCSMMVFLLMVAWDVQQICVVHSSTCEVSTFDAYVMNAMLMLFVAVVCVIIAVETPQLRHTTRAPHGYELLVRA